MKPDFRGYVCPGEVVYIPHGWLHDVLSVEDSLSVTWNFVHEAGALEFVDYLMGSASATDSEFEVLRHFYRQSGLDFATPRDVVRAFDDRFSGAAGPCPQRQRAQRKAAARTTRELDEQMSTQ